MAEIHNISDLRAIRLLEAQLLDIRNVLRESPGYDPTESLAENVTLLMEVGKYFAKRTQYLRQVVEELKKEQENDKAVARTYPLSGDGGISTVVSQPGAKTVAWYDGAGRSISDPFADYHPSRESVSERLLGSTDGYGR